MRKVFISLTLTLILLTGLMFLPLASSTRTRAAAAATAAAATGAQVDVEMVNGQEAAAGRVIVKFRDGKNTASRVREVEAATDADSDMEVGGAGARLIHSRSKDAATLVKELSARADVEYAEPDYLAYGGGTPNDSFYASQEWGLHNTGQTVGGQTGTPGADISAQQAWDISTGSRNQVIAVLDSGIDYNHPDLAPNVWSAPSPFSVTLGGQTFNCPAGAHGFNTITNTCDPADDHNHGSNVSGIIGAAGNNGTGVTGINWQTNVLGIKWLNSNNGGTISDAIDALEVAVQLKQSGLANIKVLNNSWFAGGFSQSLLDEIKRAEANGMLFVAISGNGTANDGFQLGGHDNETVITYPSSYKTPGMISVAATDNRDALAFFSNWGRTSVHLGAPGASIFSTLRGGAYGSFSGTSQAAPHVAGAAALLLSRCQLTTAGLKGVLITNVDPDAALVDKTTSGGRLNLARSLSTCASFANIIDESRFYVRQHYVDFFTREPDAAGLQFWTNNVESCGADAQCREVKRIDTSAAFFLSIEFQGTGYLVYRAYKSAFGNIAGKPVPLLLSEFTPDTQQIGQNVVVGATGWETQLETNKQNYFNSFVTRTRFTSAYPSSMTPEGYVDKLNTSSGGVLSPTERDALVAEMRRGATRAQVLRAVAEDADMVSREFNPAFVLIQYFGYLRRNPDDAPEPGLNFNGYNFWLGKLNEFNGDFRAAEMVKAFITSDEYRRRFAS
ncbi:MAG: S8 family serine peptidase [Pyrinomonadaceae bacterium]